MRPMKVLLIFISFLFLIPNFFDVSLEKIPQYDHKEKFDPSLSYINSTDKLIHVADSIAVRNNIQQGSLRYAITIQVLSGIGSITVFLNFLSPKTDWLLW